MEKKFNYTYMITNIVNNKQYIGDHSTNNLNDKYLGSGKLLTYAIKKYGKDKFKKEILEYFPSKKESFDAQEKWINEYNTLIPNGYNISLRGGYGVPSSFLNENTKEKIRQKHIGMKQSPTHIANRMKNAKGKIKGPMSEKTKELISKSKKGSTAWNFGKTNCFSNATINKMSISHTGIILSDETKLKMSKFQKNRIRSISEKENLSKCKMGDKNPMFGKVPWNKGLKLKTT